MLVNNLQDRLKWFSQKVVENYMVEEAHIEQATKAWVDND